MKEVTDALSVQAAEDSEAADVPGTASPQAGPPAEAVGGPLVGDAHVAEILRAAERLADENAAPWHGDLAVWLGQVALREMEYLTDLPPDVQSAPRPGDEAHAALVVARAYLRYAEAS